MSGSTGPSSPTLPLAGSRHKTEGPATTLVFLGIELDSVAMEIRLPREKLEQLKRDGGEVAQPAVMSCSMPVW